MRLRQHTQIDFLRNKKQRGSILFITLLFLILINLFAVAFWNLVPVELHAARRQMLETEAYFVSDAGVVDSLAFLEKITSDGNVDNYFANNGVTNADGNLVLQRSGTLGVWTWEVEIVPGPETYGNAANPAPNPLRVYELVAVAKRPGSFGLDSQQYRKVSAWVRQRSFTDNNWGNMAVGGQDLWLFMDTFRLGGDYHSNGKGLLQITNGDLWNEAQARIAGDFSFVQTVEDPNIGYTDGVQYSNWGANTVPYYTTGAQAGQPRDDRYSKISGNGRAGVKTAGAIQMPLNTDSIAFGVWGATPQTTALSDAQKLFGANSNVRVTINGATPGGPATNGIWIEGDVSQIDFSTNSNVTNGDLGNTTAQATQAADNQTIRIYQDQSATALPLPNDSYVEITHVIGQNFTLPASGATVIGNTHPLGTVLSPADNGGTGYTVVKNNSTNQYVVYQGQTNGAIYATGDVKGVRGVVKGRRSVGVSSDTGSSTSLDKTITINGNLLYSGTTPGERPANTTSLLGLIGYAVRMKDTPALAAPSVASPQLGLMWPPRSTTSVSNPNYLYTSIFAGRRNDPKLSSSGNIPTLQGGGFGSSSPDGTTFGMGHMKLYGSITEGIRQWKGTGTTGGNSYAFDLDPSLNQVQPPFFPTLPSYDILSWEERSVFSY